MAQSESGSNPKHKLDLVPTSDVLLLVMYLALNLYLCLQYPTFPPFSTLGTADALF